MLTRHRIAEVVNGFSGHTILVIGDFILDEFVWGSVRRISPEAPVPVVDITKETYCLGGAGNVVANIRSLGGKAIPAGIVGNDKAGQQIISLLQTIGADSPVFHQDERPTTRKTRIVAHGQHVVRTDRESKKPISPEICGSLSNDISVYLPWVSAVVVSDYNKGVITHDLLSRILPEAKKRRLPIFLDPKVPNSEHYRSVTVMTPNRLEAELLTGVTIEDHRTLELAGRKLLRKFDCEYALITRGEFGMSLFSNSDSYHLPTFAREVFDVTGAGDTVISALALSSAAGATMREAAIIANHAAGIAVGKIGTAAVRQIDLMSEFDGYSAAHAGA